VVRAIRNLRSEKNVKPGRRLAAVLVSASAGEVLKQQSASIAALAGLEADKLQILENLPAKPEGHIALVVGAVEIFLPLAGLVDSGEERARLEKDLAEAQGQIERLEKLLASSFAEKAPQAVVQKEREKLAAYRQSAEKLRRQMAALS
jgi:valyl-tRNA synthetase